MSSTNDIQAVTFGIGPEVFAVPVPLVREILDYQEPFRIPNGPEHFLGLIDVRGEGVPTIDLRLRLGLPRAEPTLLSRILVLEVPRDNRLLTIGLLIDKALSVSVFPRATIEAPPEIGVTWRSEYIEGVVRQDNGFVVLIDIARILTRQDAAMIAQRCDQAA